MKIAVITPVMHLEGIYELLCSKGDIFLCEEGTKEQIRELLLIEKIDVILCNPNQQTYKIDKQLLENTHVKLINTCSTGLNHIDVDYCKEQDIKIYSLTKDHKLINDLPSTAELSFGLLLDLLRNITFSNNVTKKLKRWDYLPFVGQQIKDLKIGIVGYGRLGKMMAHYCNSFGSKVYVYDPYVESIYLNVNSLDELFDVCDAVSLHVHVSEETKNMINYNLLTKGIKYLVNTSRGDIVNEFDIIKALKDKNLLGYATDVLQDEFGVITNSPFFNIDNLDLNVIITPHIGGMTIQGQTKAYKWSINKL